jgi:osmoprotectant transport system ATP-binding protein
MIRFENVSKQYAGGGPPALHGLTFEVAAGELVALVGGSGSGKTTTLKCINRLVEPSSGEVYVAGNAVRSVPGPALRRQIGYVFQGIGLFPHMSVACPIQGGPSRRTTLYC